MNTFKKMSGIFLALLILATFAACGGGSNTAPQTSGEADVTPEGGELQKVTLVLDYIPNTNHTGIYAALDLGYYRDAGLDLEIIEPIDGITTTLIAAGKGDIGISYQEDVTYALSADTPLPIKAIAAVIQHNTSGFASWEGKGITSPAQFEGKVYSGWESPAEEAVIQAVMLSHGADPDLLTIVTSNVTNYPILQESVDLTWFFEAWDCIQSELAGVPLNYIALRDLDERLDYYTPVIIASNSTIEHDPEMLGRFMEATTLGYEYVMENPDDAAELLHRHVPDYDLEMLTRSQQYLAERYSEGTDTWGLMQAEVWDRYTEFMVEYGLIEAFIPSEQLFTNEFIPQEQAK